MKKLLLTTLLALTPLLFTACGEGGEEDIDVGEEVTFEKLEGVVRKLGASIYAEGTHRLEQDGSLVALLQAAGPQIKLDNFVGETVEVEGIVSPTVEGNLEIMKVITITPEGGATEGQPSEYEQYADEQFGFSAKYPTDLTAAQTRRGVAFYDADTKIIEIIILENSTKQELSDWLIDNYGYTADALRRVSVAGLTGFQFQNTTGSVIYLGHDEQVFTLAWYDNSETNRARDRRFYLELVQSFAVSGIETTGGALTPTESLIAGDGDFCGGIAAIPCAAGLECRLSGSYPDAGGICVQTATPAATAVTSDQIGANEDLPEISATELQRGWYYGDRDAKKPGTPVTWILVDSGTRAAMWRRLDSAPAEPTVTLPEATILTSQLSSNEKTVLDYLSKNIDSLSPEEAAEGQWELAQLTFADPNFVYAVFDSGFVETQTRRLLFIYSVVDGEVSVEMQAFFRPGTEKDWLVVEGADTAFGEAQKIVNTSGEITSSIAAGYRPFIDYVNKFSFQYPKNWYWQKPAAREIEFSDRPFPAGIPLFKAEFVDGVDFTFDEAITEGSETVIYTMLDAERSMRFSIEDLDYLEVIEAAADSIEGFE